MKYIWLNQLPQKTQNQLIKIIKAYCRAYDVKYDADIMNQKIVDIIYLDTNDIYLNQIDNILKQYI